MMRLKKEITKWKCEPCGHVTVEKPDEVCLICRSPTSAVIEIRSEGGELRIKRGKKE